MLDLFDVGVKLSLVSNVSAGLRVLARDLMGIRGEIGKTQADLDRLRKVMIGAGAVTIGTAVLSGWWDLAKAGDRIIQQRQRMISQGISATEVQKNYLAALQAAAKIEGTTVSGNMALVTTLRATVGTSANARAVLPGVARDEWILRHIGQSTGDIAGILKTIEMLRFAVGANGQIDPAKFQHALDLITAGLNLDPKALLRGTQLFQFAKMAQPIASLGGNVEQFVRDYFELMTQMGRTAGRGIAYMGIKLIGGQLTKAQEATLLRLGLVTPAGIGGTKGHPALKVGAIKGFDELVHEGMLAWFRDVMLPAIKLRFGGEPNAADLSKLLSGLAGFPVTSQRALATFFNLAPMVGKFNEQLDKEMPKLNDIFGSLQDTLTSQLGDLGGAVESFLEVLGVPAAETAIPFLKELTGAIQDMTLLLGNNPWLPPLLDSMAEALGVLLTYEGGVFVLKGALGMLRVAIPDLAAALGPFVEGGFAATALRMLGSQGGLLGLALGLEALGKSFSALPPWLVHFVSQQMLGVWMARLARLPGALGFVLDLGGDTDTGAYLRWRAKHPFTKQELAELGPAGVERLLGWYSAAHMQPPSWLVGSAASGAGNIYGLPIPLPSGALAPVPLPPTPPAGNVHVTLNSPISLPVPPLSETDIESMFRRAIYSRNAALLNELAAAIVRQQRNELLPAVKDAIQHMQAEQYRRTLLDHGRAPSGAH